MALLNLEADKQQKMLEGLSDVSQQECLRLFFQEDSPEGIINAVRKKYSNLGPLLEIIASRGEIFRDLDYDNLVNSSKVIDELFLNNDIEDDKDAIPVFVAEMDDIRAEFNEFKKQKDKKNKKQTLKQLLIRLKLAKEKMSQNFMYDYKVAPDKEQDKMITNKAQQKTTFFTLKKDIIAELYRNQEIIAKNPEVAKRSNGSYSSSKSIGSLSFELKGLNLIYKFNDEYFKMSQITEVRDSSEGTIMVETNYGHQLYFESDEDKDDLLLFFDGIRVGNNSSIAEEEF